MTSDQVTRSIPGGAELIEWFGAVPRFHDAELLGIELASQGASKLRIHAFRMTDQVDSDGYYVLDRHAVVTILLEEVTYVALSDFSLPGIILDFWISIAEECFQIEWEGSYGVEGTLRAKRLRIELQPKEP